MNPSDYPPVNVGKQFQFGFSVAYSMCYDASSNRFFKLCIKLLRIRSNQLRMRLERE